MTVIKASAVIEGSGRRTLYRRAAASDPLLGTEPIDDPLLEKTSIDHSVTEHPDAMKAQRAAAFQQGFAEGMEEGFSRADAIGSRAAEQLGLSLQRAVEIVERHLNDSAELARQLTHQVLGKLVGDPSALEALVTGLIRAALSHVNAKRLLKLELSEIDFPDDAALQQMRERFRLDELPIAILPEAPSGTCRLHLQGEILDASLNVQLVKALQSVDRVSHVS